MWQPQGRAAHVGRNFYRLRASDFATTTFNIFRIYVKYTNMKSSYYHSIPLAIPYKIGMLLFLK